MHRLTFKNSIKTIPLRAFQTQLLRNYNTNYRQQYNQKDSNSNGLPPFREAGFGKFVLLLSPIIFVGGTIAYANYDREFRKFVERNVPGSEKIIKVALQEEPAFPGVTKQIDNVKNKIDSITTSIGNATSTVTSFFGGSDDKKATKPNEVDQLPFTRATKSTEPSAPTPTVSTSKTSPAVASEAKASKAAVNETKQTIAKPKPQAKPVERIPNDILELEKAVEVASTLAVKEYNKAIDILKHFNEDVRKIVDQAVENVDTNLWQSLKNRTSARDTAVSTAEKLALDAISKIEKCEVALSKIVEPSNQEQVLSIRNKIKTFGEHINKVKDELYKHKDLASISEKYWRNVEKARNYFVEEIESLFPGLNISEKKLHLSKDDVDLFILHAYSHVLAYQKELQRLQTDGEVRLKRAIDALRGDSDSEAVKAQLDYLLETEKRKLAIDNQRKIFQIRADSAKELRAALKKQAEAHMDHMEDALAVKESEMKRNYSRQLEEKLAAERGDYKLQLAAMLGKLRGMDAALQARAEAERSAHQAQALWAACQALWATVRTGEPGVEWRAKLRPLRNEIQAISRVAEGDELVAVVLESMPREAQERGVYPEDALRERFLNVERIARKLALVPEEGASIPMYLLSYLQSLFILRPDEAISKDELEDKKFDYSKLDTYDILNRARYFIDHGDLMEALKYMNLLQGAPRKIAKDWLKEARLLLETQQAANTLMAHAAASGLLYL